MASLMPFERGNNEIQRRQTGLFNLLDFDKFFSDFFNDSFLPFYEFRNRMPVDIKENDKEYMLEFELPGINKENIDIEVSDKRLTVRVNVDEAKEMNDDKYIRKERRQSTMVRSFSIENVQSDKISAKLENGILSLVLPKAENLKPEANKIKIN
ncbi:MAG TPA: Hsp20/alpha crystallin family protein [Firmicutes bacterium]|nr:Hsp20/alpha crystallin family protein [Bacillota bacterium]